MILSHYRRDSVSPSDHENLQIYFTIAIGIYRYRLLSNWEYSNLTDRIFFRHDLLQRLLNYSTLHIVLEVRLAIGQLNSFLLSG